MANNHGHNGKSDMQYILKLVKVQMGGGGEGKLIEIVLK